MKNTIKQTAYILDAEVKIVTPKIALSGSFLTIADISPDLKDSINQRVFKLAGIAKEFARLDKPKKMLEFANKYGLLKMKNSNPAHLHDDVAYFNNFKYELFFSISDYEHYGTTGTEERVDEWKWHVSHIGKLFALYSAMREDEPIENVHLYEEKGWVFWADDQRRTLHKFDQSDFRAIAWHVLHTHIRFFVDRAILVDFGIYKSRVYKPITSVLDMYCEDHKVTYYLLAAIYYDLWKTVNSLEKIKFCGHCNKPFTPKKSDQIYHDEACRKRASRS